MKYNPCAYIVKAFSQRQSLRVRSGFVLYESISGNSPTSLDISTLYLQNFPSQPLVEVFC